MGVRVGGLIKVNDGVKVPVGDAVISCVPEGVSVSGSIVDVLLGKVSTVGLAVPIAVGEEVSAGVSEGVPVGIAVKVDSGVIDGVREFTGV